MFFKTRHLTKSNFAKGQYESNKEVQNNHERTCHLDVHSPDNIQAICTLLFAYF